ncbi:hypothetical protein [Lacrimispora sp.]|uniref:hypothetical protein n=1 Tax=Lacrimispora sp. TaxID=2719234 RepID=UPI0028AB67E0|nr:hypothetical protein [Lacrimispora sp.]
MGYKDILGRELHDGDICVGKGTGRDVCGMDVGIWSGKSIAFKGGNKRSMGDVFLVVNPTEEELTIKSDIEKSLIESENKRLERDSVKTIPLSKLEVGGIYECNNNYLYLYLGKRKVTFKNLQYKNSDPKVQEGHCFVFACGSDDEKIKKDIVEIGTYHGNHRIEVLKGNKKLTKLIRKIDLEFPMVNEVHSEGYLRYSPNYHYELTVE